MQDAESVCQHTVRTYVMKARLTPDRFFFIVGKGPRCTLKNLRSLTYRPLKDLLCEAGVVASGQSVFVMGDLNVRFEQCLP